MGSVNVGFVGYGEVGRIFCAQLRDAAASVRAWDIKLSDPAVATPLRERAALDSVALAASPPQLCADSDLLISAVTASNAVAAAREVADDLRPGTVFVDLNSAAPGTKKEAAKLIDGAGGQYVEAAVMASVPPFGIKVPMLLGGPRAEDQASRLKALGLDVTVVSAQLGVASAIKMCRSVMVKGLEALVVEGFTTARAYGVESYVLPTLYKTFPNIDWAKRAAYLYSRVVQHGRRRAEEMREVSRTVREAGFEPWMSAATAMKQDWVADLAADKLFDGVEATGPWEAYADRVIQKVAGALAPDADPATSIKKA